MKIALVYDRLNKWGGAERLLLALHQIFPEAPIFTSVCDYQKTPWLQGIKVKTSFLQKVKLFRNHHQYLPFLMPLAFESFDFSGYQIVISVTSAEAKGLITKPEVMHLCYCLTPTRYLYSHFDQYLKAIPFKQPAKVVLGLLKNWDQVASQRPDRYLAISRVVQSRIKKYYNRESEIIYPPLLFDGGVKAYKKDNHQPFYLIVSRLEPYKNLDLAVKSFNKLGWSLVIAGSGSQEKYLKRLAGPTVKLVGHLTDTELFDYYKNCCALVMPQEEDFGLVALEAQRFNRPIIALARGGALETVIAGKTGIFFQEPTVESLTNCLRHFTSIKFNNLDFDKNLRQFSFEIFKRNFTRFLEKEWQQYQSQL
jgi:glycosyltransferase involved in cell wall biosynthesis